MNRNSEKTKYRILKGLEELITREGFTGVGVNAVAREAGVDKVLIYRYFGSMEGLLKAFADEKEFCPRVADLLHDIPEEAPLHEVATRIVLEHVRALQNSPLAQELACWELTEQNPLTVLFGKEMENGAMQALADRGIIPDEDVITLSVIVLCGLQYLVLRGRNNNPMMNIDYSKPETREKVERVIAAMMKAFFKSREPLT
ncbi:MAG: helix-turn-helix domain-containing protein [Candidatus Fermentibacteria bacterium]|nr:helix-turn-helix domain-containing protein [Candidatus Fermentibacteria bacterium]